MKNNKKILAIIGFFSIVISINFAFQNPDPTTEIIGTWVHNEDNEISLEFLSNGKCKNLHNNELLDVFNYEISDEDCTGYNSPITINYLKFIDVAENETYCYQVTISNDNNTLSLFYLERGTVEKYTRQ